MLLNTDVQTVKSVSPSLGHQSTPAHVRATVTCLIKSGTLCAFRVLWICSVIDCISFAVVLVLISAPSSGCRENQQPLLCVADIAISTTDLNGRQMESKGRSSPVAFNYSFSMSSNCTSLERAGDAFLLGWTDSTDS